MPRAEPNVRKSYKDRWRPTWRTYMRDAEDDVSEFADMPVASGQATGEDDPALGCLVALVGSMTFWTLIAGLVLWATWGCTDTVTVTCWYEVTDSMGTVVDSVLAPPSDTAGYERCFAKWQTVGV